MANEAAALLLGAKSASQLIGLSASDFLPPARHVTAYPRRPSVATQVRKLDGTPSEVMLLQRACEWHGQPATQVVVRAVAQVTRGESAVNHAETDQLTDLPNRRQFRAHLQAAIDRAVRNRH